MRLVELILVMYYSSDAYYDFIEYLVKAHMNKCANPKKVSK